MSDDKQIFDLENEINVKLEELAYLKDAFDNGEDIESDKYLSDFMKEMIEDKNDGISIESQIIYFYKELADLYEMKNFTAVW